MLNISLDIYMDERLSYQEENVQRNEALLP
jgi:hypothetical protein